MTSSTDSEVVCVLLLFPGNLKDLWRMSGGSQFLELHKDSHLYLLMNPNHPTSLHSLSRNRQFLSSLFKLNRTQIGCNKNWCTVWIFINIKQSRYRRQRAGKRDLNRLESLWFFDRNSPRKSERFSGKLNFLKFIY